MSLKRTRTGPLESSEQHRSLRSKRVCVGKRDCSYRSCFDSARREPDQSRKSEYRHNHRSHSQRSVHETTRYNEAACAMHGTKYLERAIGVDQQVCRLQVAVDDAG